MQRPVMILWVATLLTVIFFILSQRYEITGGYRLDRLTGGVWALSYNTQKSLPVQKTNNELIKRDQPAVKSTNSFSKGLEEEKSKSPFREQK
ncbi:MAG: hypothetical protein NTV71_04975 [Candidatus Omnitrophica bacterium]|nr:hypothetical protein [Candidatus Omnitrophota bacterium]